MTVTRRRPLIALVVGALTLALTGCGLVESITGPKPLPKACDVLTEAEVGKIVGEDVSVQKNRYKVEHGCAWRGETILTSLYFSRTDSAGFHHEKQKQVDKHGKSVVIKGLGDDAYVADNPFAKADQVVFINVLSGDLVLRTAAQRKGPRGDQGVAEALARAVLKKL